MSHIPVLLNEVIKFLSPKDGDVVLDATIDGGGHAKEICKLIGAKGKLLGIDEDDNLLRETKEKLRNEKCGIFLMNGNFRNLDSLLENLKIEKIDAALFDLGMSSLQLDDSGRGFTFQKDEPLIMSYRFPLNPASLTAQEILNKWTEKEISEILFHYGEEHYGRRIAKNIIKWREKKPLKTTFDLIEIIEKSIPFRPWHKIHPATKTFQALRIAVNDELNALSEGLKKIWRFLVPGSRIVVISFHSLEDRIVKEFFSAKGGSASGGKKQGIILTKKPIRPSAGEISENPRSRSSKLRAAIKIK